MRRENILRNNARPEIARVQNYHENSNWSDVEAYAFQGYDTNKYFTSDRYIKLDENFNRPDGKALKGYGLEIETECNSITSSTVYANLLQKMIFKVFPDGLFKLQHDGSLGGRTSAECITQVMTKEFIRNNYRNFKTMWNDYFKAFEITTQNRSCGMHVNISVGCFGTTQKVQDECARKIYYLINRHYDFFKVALNRINDTQYCQKMDYSVARTMDLDNMSRSHGNALNYSHIRAGRIEIRLVGGQKDYACFRNTMETIFFLVDRVKSLSWDDLDNLGIVFKGCNSYVFDRISTNCKRALVISDSDIEKIRETVVRAEYL